MSAASAAQLGVCYAQGALIENLGRVNGNPVYASSVSSDAKVVGGWAGGNPDLPVRWVTGTPASLGLLPVPSDTQAHHATAVNADGSVLVGYGGDFLAGFQRAFRWSGGTLTNLGILPCDSGHSCVPDSMAFAASADGSVVVGRSDSNTYTNGEPFRWAGGVMTALGCNLFPTIFQGTATGVSADGSVIVGHCSNGTAYKAFRWVNGAMSEIPLTAASAVTPDGNAVVGFIGYSNPPQPDQAARWTTGGGVTTLGRLPGGADSRALAVSADGSVVVGWAMDNTGHQVAFRWTAQTGIQPLKDLLAAAGVDVSNWSLTEATGVSADGVTIVGNGIIPGNENGGFLARLPTMTTPATTLVSSVLPVSRSVQVGSAAAAFATIINTGTVGGVSCGLLLGSSVPAAFTFQTTNPATNALTGSPNTGVNIAAGASQSYVFALTPNSPFSPTDAAITARCDNSDAAPSVTGLNTLLVSASSSPVPDIVALSATLSNDGIANIAGTHGTGVFSVASINVGVGSAITVSVDTGAVTLPVQITLCQTDPNTAQCTSPVGATVPTTIGASATPTFSVFLTGAGTVPFDPAHNRAFVRFKDSGGTVRGATSVALRTQ